jgi:predicted transcriptional regulator
MTTKEKILQALNGISEDAPIEEAIEDAIERLYVLYKIEQGLAAANAGQTVTQEEAKKRMQRWLT